MSDGRRTPRLRGTRPASAAATRPSRSGRRRRCRTPSPSGRDPSCAAASRRGKLGDAAARRGLRRLAAGIRVDLGVEHEHVHVPARRQHVVEAAVADVVRPAVAADDPDALADQVIGEREQAARRADRQPLSFAFKRRIRRRCASTSSCVTCGAWSSSLDRAGPSCGSSAFEQLDRLLACLSSDSR